MWFWRTDLLPDLVGDLIPILPLVHIFLILLVHPGRVSGSSQPSQPSYQRGELPWLLPYSQLIYPFHFYLPRSIICLCNKILRFSSGLHHWLFLIFPSTEIQIFSLKIDQFDPFSHIIQIFYKKPTISNSEKTGRVRVPDDPSPLGALS